MFRRSTAIEKKGSLQSVENEDGANPQMRRRPVISGVGQIHSALDIGRHPTFLLPIATDRLGHCFGHRTKWSLSTKLSLVPRFSYLLHTAMYRHAKCSHTNLRISVQWFFQSAYKQTSCHRRSRAGLKAGIGSSCRLDASQLTTFWPDVRDHCRPQMEASTIDVMAFEHSQIVVHLAVASITILIYDFLLTLFTEISLVWSSPWTLVKVLFLLARYMPFADAGLILYYQFRPHTAEECHILFKTMSWLFFVGTAMPEILLTIRTWTVWDRGRRLGIGLAVCFTACWSSIIVIIWAYIKSIEVLPVESPTSLGCLVSKGSQIIYARWISLLVYDSGIAFLMLLKGIQCYKDGGFSGLFLVIFRDALVYYLCLSALSIVKVLVVFNASPNLQVVVAPTECLFHSIIGCRGILAIRAHASATQEGLNRIHIRN